MKYKHITVPAGQVFSKDIKVTHPIIPCITGDGIGQDITPVMKSVVDAAVSKAYGITKQIAWMEVPAGGKAIRVCNDVLPEETLHALKKYGIGIKGPLETPVGGGFRSINVTLRQTLDLYTCQRPVKYYDGVPSPLKNPEKTDMVVFRENAEDIYAGIEWEAGTEEASQVINFLETTMGANIPNNINCGIGIKPVSEAYTKRLVRAAMQYAIDHNKKNVALVHKGNIMKFTEGAFKKWGYEVAEEMNVQERGITVTDVIADNMLQQILLYPEKFDVIATLNLNGDYISDALAAQVGGIGIAPGANISDDIAIFEATHGTAPDIAGQGKANPCSIILSAEMMLRYMGWHEAADLIDKGIKGAIKSGVVTIDFHSQMPESTLATTKEFGNKIIGNM